MRFKSLHKSIMYKVLFNREFTFISKNVIRRVLINLLLALLRRLRLGRLGGQRKKFFLMAEKGEKAIVGWT